MIMKIKKKILLDGLSRVEMTEDLISELQDGSTNT